MISDGALMWWNLPTVWLLESMIEAFLLLYVIATDC